MRKNEPTAADRVAVVPFYDLNGQLKSGLTFSGAGECAIWNVDSGSFTDTTNDPTEIGTTGQYFIQLEQSETNHNTMLKVRLRKATYEDQFLDIPITTFDLDDLSARLDTIDTTLATIAGYIDTEIALIKAKTDNLPADTAAVLTAIDDYIDTEVATIKTTVDGLVIGVAAIGESVALVAGLHRRNSVLDGGDGFPSVQYDGNSIMTVGRLRVFADEVDAAAATAGAADDADGETHRYRLLGVAAAGKLASMRMLVELEP